MVRFFRLLFYGHSSFIRHDMQYFLLVKVVSTKSSLKVPWLLCQCTDIQYQHKWACIVCFLFCSVCVCENMRSIMNRLLRASSTWPELSHCRECEIRKFLVFNLFPFLWSRMQPISASLQCSIFGLWVGEERGRGICRDFCWVTFSIVWVCLRVGEATHTYTHARCINTLACWYWTSECVFSRYMQSHFLDKIAEVSFCLALLKCRCRRLLSKQRMELSTSSRGRISIICTKCNSQTGVGGREGGGVRASTDGSVGSARVAYVVQFNWNANQSWAPLEATIEIVERPSGRMREVEKAYRKSALNGRQTGSVAVLVCSHFRKLFSKASLEINVKAQQMIKCLHSTTNANETLPLSELGLMSCMWFDSIRCELHIYFLS